MCDNSSDYNLPSFVAPSLSPCLFTPCCNPQREHEHAPLNSTRVCREGEGEKSIVCYTIESILSVVVVDHFAQIHWPKSQVASWPRLSRCLALACIARTYIILCISSIHICFIYFLILLIQFAFAFLLQLYEINDDPKRKEFLDDLFSFMQKRGKYSNRECAKRGEEV